VLRTSVMLMFDETVMNMIEWMNTHIYIAPVKQVFRGASSWINDLWVFFANVWEDSDEVCSSMGRLFHDTAKSRRLIVVLVHGTTSVPLSADRNCHLVVVMTSPSGTAYMGVQKCPEETRNFTRLWIWRDPSLPSDSWQPLLTGHHSRAAVVAHSWRIVDHCQTIDVDGCRHTVKLQSVLRLWTATCWQPMKRGCTRQPSKTSPDHKGT